ncbi:colipase-like protein 2 [Balaenoptera acutorostrata]|uniref:Colipase-like protein 2 n=1 Tax=Balaenoptera acutorostrata TaxID=9767 RepID=A0A384BEA7_BALAC|nr:colipase-like protein 2 [Balaenoptera acutorostrata]
MAAALAILAAMLLPCWGAFPQFKKGSTKMNGARCSHHSECYSDCCLINLDHGGAFCVPRARITMMCLPQTKGAINIICPCQVGLSCIHKDPVCTRRCHLI